MKICYLADAGSIHTQRWVKYFADNGHEVHLISFRSFGDCNIENVKLHLLKRLHPQIRFIAFPTNLLFEMIQVRKLIKKINLDIVHAHYVTDYGFRGALAGFHPFVVTAWGSDVLRAPTTSKISKFTAKFALNKADLITCDGENSKDAMINLGIKSQRIELIFHGVDTKIFNSKQKDKKVIKNLFGEEKFPVVISARLLVPKNNVETIIKAVPLIIKKIPEAKFIIGGEGPEENYLKELAESLGILNSIRFVGWIPHDELPKYLASSDVYVSTSLWDGGVAVATLDAMACELAPVVTDVADNKKWIKDGENGFIVPIKNPKLLAEKVIYLLDNKENRKRLGEINGKIIEEKQNYEKEMLKMEKLYKKLIGT